eukprot:Mrub_07181.p3 GENE.Mrub_07181~~Mrub_07181.p3  ORF type:complete len:101 (-),score=1.84 Mrub_07181:50-352(-)
MNLVKLVIPSANILSTNLTSTKGDKNRDSIFLITYYRIDYLNALYGIRIKNNGINNDVIYNICINWSLNYFKFYNKNIKVVVINIYTNIVPYLVIKYNLD